MKSIGSAWKERLEKNKHLVGDAEKCRAEMYIYQLQKQLETSTERQCFVMALYSSESLVSFDELRGKQHRSHAQFLGAAKVVVDYCLQNDLDVYVWAGQFRHSTHAIGAAIWVTPHGVAPSPPTEP